MSETVVDIHEVRQMTNKVKETQNAVYVEACQAAFDYVLDGAVEKIRDAAQSGRTRSYLYNWKYLDDPNDNTHSFNGVRIMDILTKGNLLERLRSHFNPENLRDGYYVNWHKFRPRDVEPTEYGLYVSWYVPREPREPRNLRDSRDPHETREEKARAAKKAAKAAKYDKNKGKNKKQ